MKRLLVFTMMIVTAIAGWAQRSPAEIARGQAAALTKKLSLTAVQKDSVEQICQTYHQKMARLRNLQLSMDELGKRMQLFDDEWTSQLQRVLSADQYRRLLED